MLLLYFLHQEYAWQNISGLWRERIFGSHKNIFCDDMKIMLKPADINISNMLSEVLQEKKFLSVYIGFCLYF